MRPSGAAARSSPNAAGLDGAETGRSYCHKRRPVATIIDTIATMAMLATSFTNSLVSSLFRKCRFPLTASNTHREWKTVSAVRRAQPGHGAAQQRGRALRVSFHEAVERKGARDPM